MPQFQDSNNLNQAGEILRAQGQERFAQREAAALDPYEAAVGQKGTTGQGTIGPAGKSYTVAKNGEAEKEMRRQREMTQRMEEFLGVPSVEPGIAPEERPEPIEEEPRAEEEMGLEMLFAQEEAARQQMVQEEAIRQRAIRPPPISAGNKQQQLMRRRVFRQIIAVVFPVAGILAAFNLELFHDRFKPLIPGVRQEPDTAQGLATVAGDGCCCCCGCLLALFPLLVIAAIIVSFNPF